MATVTVRGQASEDVEPDRVVLEVTVQAAAATAAEALALVAPRSAALDEALDGAGDLVLRRRPAAVWVNPTWSPIGQVTGQAARRTVTVEARAAGPLGALLAAVVAVPGAGIGRTEWVVDPANPAHSRLRSAAVLDARARALDYARPADLLLGALESITEPGTAAPQEKFFGAAAMAVKDSGTDSPVLELRPEPVTVSAAVDVRYAVLPGPATQRSDSGA